jgi:hypothetical protein
MGTLLCALAVGVLTLAGLTWLAVLGIRNGDRPLDATVSVELRQPGQPDEERPVIIAEVGNPSGSPVIVGLRARRSRVPGWFSAGSGSAGWRTSRRELRADRYETVGVVPAGAAVRFGVPVPQAGKRYLLTAVIGQSGGRLRVHRRPVDDRDRLWLPVADLTGWRRV